MIKDNKRTFDDILECKNNINDLWHGHPDRGCEKKLYEYFDIDYDLDSGIKLGYIC